MGGSVAPLMTMAEGSALIDPRMWVEIEAVAVAPPAAASVRLLSGLMPQSNGNPLSIILGESQGRQ